ncbi:hypothetical protein HMPREF0682_1032 [Propionibacterium acidifaciens F0233]|uniref:Uncharacterized protein n=1 Tax=Propionibacterium acidifaciens F0233 TaxID=553198 RepID=U2QQD7_9ACTN|nr:hypothetical protein HMPREF0682_1032 [Propionibacterium acidifaciens F0233]
MRFRRRLRAGTRSRRAFPRRCVLVGPVASTGRSRSWFRPAALLRTRKILRRGLSVARSRWNNQS